MFLPATHYQLTTTSLTFLSLPTYSKYLFSTVLSCKPQLFSRVSLTVSVVSEDYHTFLVMLLSFRSLYIPFLLFGILENFSLCPPVASFNFFPISFLWGFFAIAASAFNKISHSSWLCSSKPLNLTHLPLEYLRSCSFVCHFSVYPLIPWIQG